MSDSQARTSLFESCVERYHPSLYRVAYRLTGRQALAMELVQETYLQAWQGLSSLRDPERMRSWLFAIMRRQYLKHMERNVERSVSDLPTDSSGFAPSSSSDWLEEQVSVASDITRIDRSEWVQWALSQIDVRYRFPLLLQWMEELSVQEISEVLDLPTGTVVSHLHRGRQALRRVLERESLDERH